MLYRRVLDTHHLDALPQLWHGATSARVVDIVARWGVQVGKYDGLLVLASSEGEVVFTATEAGALVACLPVGARVAPGEAVAWVRPARPARPVVRELARTAPFAPGEKPAPPLAPAPEPGRATTAPLEPPPDPATLRTAPPLVLEELDLPPLDPWWWLDVPPPYTVAPGTARDTLHLSPHESAWMDADYKRLGLEYPVHWARVAILAFANMPPEQQRRAVAAWVRLYRPKVPPPKG